MPDTTIIAICFMALATLFARMAGPVIMLFVPLSPRVERFLEALSISVIAAIVASYLAQNGAREGAAVAAAGLAMLGLRNAIWGMLAAMAVGAIWVALTGGG